VFVYSEITVSQPAIVLQCDFSTRTMTEVSDRIADNRNAQFGFNIELDASRSSPNKGMQTSVRSTGLGRCFCYLLTLPDPKRSPTHSMLNPYETPNPTAATSDSNHRPPAFAPRLVRVATYAIGGYFAPFVILVPMFTMKFGLQPPGEWVSGLADWHWPITTSGLALLVPNLCCMVELGAAGFRKNVSFNPPTKPNRWLSLGIATLTGYSAMLAVVFVLDPLPGSWSAERTNVVQSAFALFIPTLVSLRWLLIGSDADGGEPCVSG